MLYWLFTDTRGTVMKIVLTVNVPNLEDFDRITEFVDMAASGLRIILRSLNLWADIDVLADSVRERY